jgi:glycosyltransferase involved in cell wall biosynthesis
MKILFIGGVFDEEMEKDILIKSKGTVHYAANKLQWNLIDGLLSIDDLKLSILSAPLIGAFPNDYQSIKINGRNTYYSIVKCNYVGFNNIWGYRNISRKRNLIKGLKDFACADTENKVIIVYSPHTPFLQAAIYAKKIDPSIHICLIVPDLPQFMNLNHKRSFIYEKFKKIDIAIFKKISIYIDSFVLLTEQMKEILNIGKRPHIVVEGVVKKDSMQIESLSSNCNNSHYMSIVYTGTLNRKFGIIKLVEAFRKINIENVQLKICGSGDSEEIIKSFASQDDRIIFLGQLSNKDAVKLQKSATLLVNPRPNNEEFTKYSFPSKNLEYMLTGRPVVAYKLDGIPEEYDKYICYVEDDSIDSLKSTIENILLMDEVSRIDLGNMARSFVLNEKNNILASKRIIDMIQKSRSK